MTEPNHQAGEGDAPAGEKVVTRRRGWFRRLFAFVGPAYLVSVGYMDPGNWATDLEGGARFGYTLLWVILMSNLMAVLLQTLAARLGIVTGFDLAQGCRREYPRAVNVALWGLAELAVAATDLAEALGTIVGLNLLFGIPLLWGCAITATDTLLFLMLQRFGIRKIEAFIVMLVATIGLCFVLEVIIGRPDWHGVAQGFVPRLPPGALYVVIGIIGATVMPHNLYLHSSLVQTRSIARTLTGRKEACRFNFIDSLVALNGAFFVNAAILIMAASTFHSRGLAVTEIQQAHSMLDRVLGTTLAPVAFAVALLASGQSSTVTGTLSGQIVMEGFLNLRMRPWLRRLTTRFIALVPAVVAIALAGDKGVYKLLILSQVVLSLQLPFATIPLIHFTSDRKKMGLFANRAWVKALAWAVAGVIVALNLKLAAATVADWTQAAPAALWIVVAPALLALLGLLLYLAFAPLLRPGKEWPGSVVTESASVAAALKPLAIRYIGVAVEHTAGDAAVVSAALSQAKAYGARLTLLHVVDTPGAQLMGAEGGGRHGAEDAAYLEELARELEGPHQAVETVLRFGKPAEQILRAAEEEGFDMLILGSHGHRGFEDLVYGQTVTSVRHALSIPVLIVRTTEREQAQRE